MTRQQIRDRLRPVRSLPRRLKQTGPVTLDAFELAEYLDDAGFIKVVAYDGHARPMSYRDLKALPKTIHGPTPGLE